MNVKPLLVAIVGGSGSGKTWLCEQLCAALGERAARLSLDDFYRDRSHLSPRRRARINFDHPRAIDWTSFERVLHKCMAGKPALIPRYNFKTHTRDGRPRVFRPKPVVLVDGLWLLRRARLRKLFDVSVFLHCSAQTRLKRRVERDLLNRGRSAASVREQIRDTVEPMHERFVEPQARWAQLVFRRALGAREVAELANLINSPALSCPERRGSHWNE